MDTVQFFDILLNSACTVLTEKTKIREDKVITQERDVFKCAGLFVEFQLASPETALGMQDVSHTHTHTRTWVYLYSSLSWPCRMHYAFYACRLTPPSFPNSFISVTLCLSLFFSQLNVSPALLHFATFEPSCFFGNKCSAAEDTPLTLVTSLCLLLPRLPPSLSCLCSKAVISVVQCSVPRLSPFSFS